MEHSLSNKSNLSELNRSNHEQWFRRIKLRLEGEDIFYTAEMSLEAFAMEGRLAEIKLKNDNESSSSSLKAEKLEGYWNQVKKAQFKKDQAKLLSDSS